MRVQVAFTPAEPIAADVGVVVDVIRATSTLSQALASGYRRILCCSEVDEARAAAGRERDAALGGERFNVRIDGFDFGNSPAEYLQPRAGTLVFTTTNGTRMLVAAAQRCGTVFLGSLMNLAAVVSAVRATGAAEVAILCAGVRGELALDDAYCAGRIAEAIGGEPADSAVAAIRLAQSFTSHTEGLAASQSARNLFSRGMDADLELCARESVVDAVGRYSGMVGPAAEVVPA